jgi:hypothetical protein
MWFRKRGNEAETNSAREPNYDRSILSRVEVQRAISNGAPATPWDLRKQDHEAIDRLATYFAKAIPVPTEDGRVRIVESAGYGGPQIELFVPVLSEKTPVVVLARNWHTSGDLEADLFFFGAPDGRLAQIVKQLGFVQRHEPQPPQVIVYRNSLDIPRKRAS